MKPLLRSWQLLLLIGAILLAPQLSLVHALSHVAPQSSSSSKDERQQAPDKVCDTCLALAHMGAAVPMHFDWRLGNEPPAEVQALPRSHIALRPLPAFHARGPPSALS